MKKTPIDNGPLSEIAIFERLLTNGKGDLKPTLARYLLTLGFGDEDKARMHDLSVKNQEGALPPSEVEELLGYAKAGCLLGILQAKARKALKRTETQHHS